MSDGEDDRRPPIGHPVACMRWTPDPGRCNREAPDLVNARILQFADEAAQGQRTHNHVAAAAYLMKHAGTTALMVADAQTGQPVGIIIEADVAHAIADGKDVNDVWVNAVMTTRPAVITTTSTGDAAKIMTVRHFRHLPVAGNAGLLGVVDIIDVRRALINAGEG